MLPAAWTCFVLCLAASIGKHTHSCPYICYMYICTHSHTLTAHTHFQPPHNYTLRMPILVVQACLFVKMYRNSLVAGLRCKSWRWIRCHAYPGMLCHYCVHPVPASRDACFQMLAPEMLASEMLALEMLAPEMLASEMLALRDACFQRCLLSEMLVQACYGTAAYFQMCLVLLSFNCSCFKRCLFMQTP